MAQMVMLEPGAVGLAQWRAVLDGAAVGLDVACRPAIRKSAAAIQAIVAEGRVVYGVNTGFGKLASTHIAKADLETLQQNLVLSHSTGTGAPLPEPVTRLIMAMKAASLARGYSGISEATLDHLMAMLDAGVLPVIPEKGSVGASGDLAPLAHMTAAMLGVGRARLAGRAMPAGEALAHAGLAPVTLDPKEGLALLNGTQVSTAYALKGLFEAEDLFAAATVCGSLTVEATLSSRSPFDARIHDARGQQGQIDAAAAYRHLLGERSAISDTHADCDKVQDPYSLRCQPQVMGACLTQLRQAAEVLSVEVNAVSDNPLVFVEGGDIISGGNFHAEPVAMAADNLALAIAEIGSLTERRVSLMMDKHMSQLPPFLVENGGINSGFMIAQVTAAALASENKALSHPHSVDSLPTSANQEDHVSMAPAAGKRLWEMADNVRGILAIEWLAACQGLEFRKAPDGERLATTEPLERARGSLREKVAYYDKDRFFAPDIEAATELLKTRILNGLVPTSLLPSH